MIKLTQASNQNHCYYEKTRLTSQRSETRYSKGGLGQAVILLDPYNRNMLPGPEPQRHYYNFAGTLQPDYDLDPAERST
ncbi:MAG: hypothetical protein AAFZ15_27090 [Bacteroidota bacterium]